MRARSTYRTLYDAAACSVGIRSKAPSCQVSAYMALVLCTISDHQQLATLILGIGTWPQGLRSSDQYKTHTAALVL